MNVSLHPQGTTAVPSEAWPWGVETIFRNVSAWPKPLVTGLLLALVIAVGWIDYITGLELSVSLLYLVPIALGTWISGRSLGCALSVASAGAWFTADFLQPHAYGHWFVPIWNTLTLAISFLLVAVLLGSLREINEGLERVVARRTKALQAEISQRRRAEEDLTHALNDAQTAHLELQRAQLHLIEAAKMESAAQLAVGIAHEVKNPLMALSLGVDYFLGRRPANADEAQLAQDMKEAVHRASSVIDVLLDYSHPRPLQRTSEDIHHVIENSLALVRHQLTRQHIAVEREFETTLDRVWVDRTRAEQVFVNLFLNAIQAMPLSGKLTVRTFSTPLNSDSDHSGVTVEIDDTGEGIMPEKLGRLFEPFFTTKPPGQGTGLGLTNARQIMDLHGGSLLLNNRDEGGARATLHFNPSPDPCLFT